MAEKITLNAPVVRPSVSDYDPVSLYIQVYPSASIRAVLISNIGILEVFDYPAQNTAFDTSDKVLALIQNQINTGNFTTRSMWKKIMDRLIVDFASRFNSGATVS